MKKQLMIMKKDLRIIISGGGTGGHIFPAISIANAIKELLPETKEVKKNKKAVERAIANAVKEVIK